MKKNIKPAALLLCVAMIGSAVLSSCALKKLGYGEGSVTNPGYGVSGAAVDSDWSLVPGDVDGDGSFANGDVTRLMRYIAGHSVEVNPYTSDPDHSDSISNGDITRLMRALAGHDVELYVAVPDVTTPQTLGETEDPNEPYPPIVTQDEPNKVTFDLSGLVIVEDRDTDYKIVCRGSANTYARDTNTQPVYTNATPEFEAAYGLQQLIKDMTGVTIPIQSDPKDLSTAPKVQAKEIVVGITGRDFSSEIDYDSLTGDAFVIKTIGEKIVITGGVYSGDTADNEAEGTWKAMEYFIKEYLQYNPEEELLAPKTDAIGLPKNIDVKVGSTETGLTLKENATIDGFTVVGYGNVNYEGLWEHNAYSNRAILVPCYSTERNVTAIVTKAVKNQSLIFNNADGYASHVASCEACQKAAEEEGTVMGAYFKVVKRVADELKASNPDAVLRIVAIHDTYTPPKTYLGDNVEVLVVNRKLCSAHAVNDASCAINAAFAANVAAWQKVAGHISVLDFTSDYYYFPISFPNFYTLKENVAWYKAQNFYAVYLQFDADQSDLEFSALRRYLCEVLLQNPKMSDAEYSEFINSGLAFYYGGTEKAGYIRQYIDLFNEQAHKDGHCFDIYSEPDQILAMKVVVDGIVSYDTAFAKEAYNLWESAHPYKEILARSDTFISRMISSRYMSLPQSHAKTQYQEWLTSVIDMNDRAWVLNRILNQDILADRPVAD